MSNRCHELEANGLVGARPEFQNDLSTAQSALAEALHRKSKVGADRSLILYSPRLFYVNQAWRLNAHGRWKNPS